MNVTFACPVCGRPDRVADACEWRCPGCDHSAQLHVDPTVPACAVCGNTELYKKKNFPHWLGLTILALASLLFLAGHGLYLPKFAWAILIGSAMFDGALYLWVGDVVVCYRCGARYHGLSIRPEHKPFELGVAERYRQERIRREQLQSEKK